MEHTKQHQPRPQAPMAAQPPLARSETASAEAAPPRQAAPGAETAQPRETAPATDADAKRGAKDELRCTLCGLRACWTS